MQIKVLLMAVKDFDPDCGDAAYTVGIVDLLLKCVELSYRTGNFLMFYQKRIEWGSHKCNSIIVKNLVECISFYHGCS